MNIHYFQHDSFEDLAYIGDWAAQKGYSTSVSRFDLDPWYPEMESFDWLIIMGGKMGANDESAFPWLINEKSFIRKAIESGKIVVGICLGAQLIASALGAIVYENKEPEIGFYPVSFDKNSNNDPVFNCFPGELTVFHLHNDTFDLPEKAIRMASSQLTPNQAFRYGNHVFAFQFHIEVTQGTIPLFINEVLEGVHVGNWIQDVRTIRDLASNCDRNNSIFSKVLDAIDNQSRQQSEQAKLL